VPYGTVAIAAVHIARFPLFNAPYDETMRDLQPVARDLIWEILVTDQALARILGAHVGDQTLVSNLFV
jgi:hypothetical protein